MADAFNGIGKVVAIEHLTLDGVYQAPARPDEDLRDGFPYGGWSNPTNEQEAMQEVIGKQMSRGGSLLAGSKTYEDLYGVWPKRPANPMSDALNHVEKFVASRNPTYPLPWQNSTLLKGDAADAVAKLKKERAETLVVFGSGVLVASLAQRGLVDEFVLMIHPLVLGKGRRLFEHHTAVTKLELVDSVTASTGVIIGTYRVART